MNQGNDGFFDTLAWFGILLGVVNMEKNTHQQEEQALMQKKLDAILIKLSELEEGIL